jgi:hypothetical protein
LQQPERERLELERARLEQERLARERLKQWEQEQPDPAWEEELARQIAEHEKKHGRTCL